jgi:S-adenosylmethionine uptake transporter
VPTLGPRERRLIAWRALFEVAASVFFLTAVFNMPLANATAILQAVPLVVALGAGLFHGEVLGRRTYGAIGLGLAGVLLILRPGADGFNVFALSALAAVLSVAARDLVTRSFPVHLPTLTAAVWSAAAVGLFGLPLGLAETWITPTPRHWALVGAASITILAAILLSLAAMRAGSAVASAPFRYTVLVWSLLLGFVLFGEWPDAVALLGAALIVGAGLHGLRARPPG